MYALLPDKSEATYDRLLSIIKAACSVRDILLQGKKVKLDFEKACMNSFQKVLDLDISGCTFHLSQSLWRKAQALGLQSRIMEEDAYKKAFRRCCALCFLPPDKIIVAFAQILYDAPETDEMTPLFDYIVETYLGTNGDSDAILPVSHWNHWSSYDESSNNKVEGWHRRMNSKLRGKHPNIYRFL